MEKVLLPNRDGDKNYLVQISEDEFKLVLENPETPCSVTFCDKNQENLPFEKRDILFVDPTGGNPIGVGEIFGGRWTITKVRYQKGTGFIFSVKKYY